MNDGDTKKFPQLFSLIKAVLSISHANVVPERGFSINKHILSLHGNSLKERTIVALRIVKDFVCIAGGATRVNITLPMIKSMKEAYSRYSIELAARRELEAKVAKEEKKETILNEKLQVEQNEKLMQVNQDIQFTKDSIQSVEQVIIEKCQYLQIICPKSSFLMQMSLDRKRTRESSPSDLETKIKKL